MAGRLPNERTFIVGPSQVAMTTSADILAGFSPLFDVMFFGHLPENRETIPLPDDDPDIFAALIEYVHSMEVRLPSIEFAIRTYDLASKYFIATLQHLCAEYIFTNYDKLLGLGIYERFKETNAPEKTIKRALELCQFYAEEILQSDSHLNVHITTLIDLFKCEQLNIVSEFTLVLALFKFKEVNKSCTAEQINTAFNHIRVLSIAPMTLLRKDNAAIISEFANLNEILELPENYSGWTGTFNPSTESRNRSWTSGLTRMCLRAKDFQQQQYVIKKYTTSVLMVYTNQVATLKGVVLGLPQQYVIPEVDVIITVQDGKDRILAGERFHLKNLDSMAVKCFFREGVYLSGKGYYDLGVIFMNTICTHSVYSNKDIYLRSKYHYVSANHIRHSNQAINAILKGLIITI